MRPSPAVPDQPGPPSPAGLHLHQKRCILATLAPLTGTRATGTAIVKATGGAVVLPAASVAIPIVASTTASAQSQTDWTRLVKAGPLPDPTVPSTRLNPIQHILIDPVAEPDGTAVPIYSLLGGAHHNASAVSGLAAGTGLRWDPPIAGIELTSTITVGMSGGADTMPLWLTNGVATPAALRRIVLFDRLGIGNLALKGASSIELQVWRSKIGDFPAGVLILMGSRKREDGGRGRPIHEFRWRLLVLTSSSGPTEERYQDGNAALDIAAGLLDDMGDIDGQVFSVPRVEIGDSNLLLAEDALTIHHLDFTTQAQIIQIDPRVFASWSSTETKTLTDPTSEYPDPADAIATVDVEANQ